MRQNKVIRLSRIIYFFFSTLIGSVVLFVFHVLRGKKTPLKENIFLDIMNFIFHTGPKNFWKKPTGLQIGRSLATLLLYMFHKEDKFRKVKK